MTDYQRVRVLSASTDVVRIEVVEDNPDVAALSAVVSAGALEAGSEPRVRKLAAILLLDEKGRLGVIRRPSTGEPVQPEDVVRQVELESIHAIGVDSGGAPRFHAVLRVSMTDATLASAFAVGEEWGAAAELGGDLEDCFS